MALSVPTGRGVVAGQVVVELFPKSWYEVVDPPDTDMRNCSAPDAVPLYMLYPVAPESAVQAMVIGYAVAPSAPDTSNDGVVSGAGEYIIYRSTSPTFSNATQYVSNTNSFTDTNIQQTSSLPTATWGATSVVYNGYVYEIGGYNGSAYVATVDYAPINSNGTIGTWTATTPLLVAVDLATSVVYNGYVYEIGGWNGSANFATVDYAPINSNGTIGSWTATTSLPVATSSATSVVYNGYVYEIGGDTTATVATVDYAPILSSGALGTWTATTSLPVATYLATSVVYNGYVYEIGGYNGSVNFTTVDYAPILSSGTLGTWLATTSLPQAIRAATSVVYNGYLYEIGGYTTATVATVYYFKAMAEGGLLQQSKGSVQTNAMVNQNGNGNLNLTGGG